MDVDFETEPIQDDVYLRDLWPTSAEIQETIAAAIHGEMFATTYADVFTGDEQWRDLPVPEGDRFAWDPGSTYVRRPTYLQYMTQGHELVGDIRGAYCLVSLGDSVTTDHISPAGSIRPHPPAGRFPLEHRVQPPGVNSHRAPPGDHQGVGRGTVAHVGPPKRPVPPPAGDGAGQRA